jgi:hypothetical protein
MVTKAFESATGKGGLFNNMLEQMGGTTGGKIAQMEGGMEALKIAMGEKMMPVVTLLVDGMGSLINRYRQMIEVPIERKLTDQITKIRALHGEITSSNTSHERQLALFRELEQINPNIVKGIDAQNISYAKLAENVERVTGALRTKIAMEQFNKENASVLSAYNDAKLKQEKSAGAVWGVLANTLDEKTLGSNMTQGQKQLAAIKILENRVAKDPRKGVFYGGSGGTGGVGNTTWSSEDKSALNLLTKSIRDYNAAGDVLNKTGGKVSEIQRKNEALKKSIDGVLGIGSMTAAQIENNGGKANGNASLAATGKEVASGITGGGPRVVNINGVKFADKIEIHGSTIGETTQSLERTMEEMFLRVLNSGASLQ